MTTYTLANIGYARITKAGDKLYERMPHEIRYNAYLDWDSYVKMRIRVQTILSLMARNGSKSCSAMENGLHPGPMYDYYVNLSWNYKGVDRATMLKRADEAGREWVSRWEKEGKEATRRLNELAVILSEITGYTWTIGSELGNCGKVLVIPEGVTGARPNAIDLEGGRSGISLIHF
jgi:hypothetical protein